MDIKDRLQTKQALIDFEKRISELYRQGKIRGPIHLSKNNEETLMDIFERVQPDDWIFTTYRNHYHALLKGIPEAVLEDQIIAGQSMHIMSREHRFVTSSIVAGHIPISLGVAMALKRKGFHQKVWTFCGDMAAETGVFHEATKYAMNYDLPITFIVEDDGLGVYTPTQEVWGAKGLPGNYAIIPCSSVTEGLEKVLDKNPKVLRYKYQRGWPHHGIGVWIEFPDEKDHSKKHLDDYHREINKAMLTLSADPRVLFLGQTVVYPGSPITKSLEGVSNERRLEMPVIEETQMGASIGLALEGFLPVSIFPRFDFLTLGTNQLVNHLDKMYKLSDGQFDPKVIIRTIVGTKVPINPGPQHYQDHTEAYSRMLTRINVNRIESADQILPAYLRAIKSEKSSLLIESSKLFNGK